jgi:hypothetical protein
MTEKLDIFGTLREVDKRNINYYDNLPPDVQKSFAPVMFMRWYSSGSDMHTKLMNATMNPLVFKMYKHPGLMYKLMVACSDGKQRQYSWIKKKTKDKSAPTATAAVKAYYDCSHKDAVRYRKQFSLDDILEIADELGYDKEQVKKIKTELK